MDKINTLAGKYKSNVDKKEKGKSERIEECKKQGVASNALDKQANPNQVVRETPDQVVGETPDQVVGETPDQVVKANQGNEADEPAKPEKPAKPAKLTGANARAKSMENTKARMLKRLADLKASKETPSATIGPVSTTIGTIAGTVPDAHAPSTGNGLGNGLDNADANIAKIKQLMAQRKGSK
jgi:hypothetical protein